VPVFRLSRAIAFPDPAHAEADGLLAVGGDLRPERVLAAYRAGIFPWYSEGMPPLWYSPDPRFVLEPAALRVPRSLAKVIRAGRFEIRFDTAFAEVIDACAAAPRPGQAGTWITAALRQSFLALHAQGHAHSAEAWLDGVLVGGLYGLAVGDLFSGESMFARAPDASKVAFVTLVAHLRGWGFGLIDSQVYTDHLARFGAAHVPRADYLGRVRALTAAARPPGPWVLDPTLQVAPGFSGDVVGGAPEAR
jgi:leucyl/phenylalanyl-tRNA--protein transferase